MAFTFSACTPVSATSSIGFRFGLASTTMAFADGASFCSNRVSGTMASIHSDSENTLALNLIRSNGIVDGVWIGLQDTTNAFTEATNNVARFKWIDGTSFNFGTSPNTSPWGLEEPNNDLGEENCVQIIDFDEAGFLLWNDQPCEDFFPVLCRSSCALPTAAPTKKPTKTPTKSPTSFPTKLPTKSPTSFPTKRPTKSPSKFPSSSPTASPSHFPTLTPTNSPNLSGLSDSAELDVISLAIGVVGAAIIFSLLGLIFFLTRSKKTNLSKTKLEINLEDIITSDDKNFRNSRRPSGIKLLSMAVPQPRGSSSVSTVIAPLFRKGFTLKKHKYEASSIKNAKKISDGSNVANVGETSSKPLTGLKISSKAVEMLEVAHEDTSENGIETYIDDVSASRPARQHPEEVGTVMSLPPLQKQGFFSLKPKTSQLFPPKASITKSNSTASANNPRYFLNF